MYSCLYVKPRKSSSSKLWFKKYVPFLPFNMTFLHSASCMMTLLPLYIYLQLLLSFLITYCCYYYYYYINPVFISFEQNANHEKDVISLSCLYDTSPCYGRSPSWFLQFYLPKRWIHHSTSSSKSLQYRSFHYTCLGSHAFPRLLC